MRATLALLLWVLLIAPALAQGGLSAADLSGTWQGHWVSPTGFIYDTTLTLKVAPDGAANGAFAWVLKRSPRPEEQAKIGNAATEYVSGRIDAAAHTVALQGIRKDDPNSVIDLDAYRMMISDDGRVMGGITHNHGNWQGQIILNRTALTQ